MNKSFKDRIAKVSIDGTALKNLTEGARETIEAMVTAHKTAITFSNCGYLVGRAARKVTQPWRELWHGVKQGFMAGQ